MNQTTGRTKSDSATLDFTLDDINEYFANICHTKNYLEPEIIESLDSSRILSKSEKKTAVGFGGILAWLLSKNAHK